MVSDKRHFLSNPISPGDFPLNGAHVQATGFKSQSITS